jgi:hypothetical protein
MASTFKASIEIEVNNVSTNTVEILNEFTIAFKPSVIVNAVIIGLI